MSFKLIEQSSPERPHEIDYLVYTCDTCEKTQDEQVLEWPSSPPVGWLTWHDEVDDKHFCSPACAGLVGVDAFKGVDTTERDSRPWGLHGIKGVRERLVCACGLVTGEWGTAGELWTDSQQTVNKNPGAREFNELLRINHRPERGGGCI